MEERSSHESGMASAPSNGASNSNGTAHPSTSGKPPVSPTSSKRTAQRLKSSPERRPPCAVATPTKKEFPKPLSHSTPKRGQPRETGYVRTLMSTLNLNKSLSNQQRSAATSECGCSGSEISSSGGGAQSSPHDSYSVTTAPRASSIPKHSADSSRLRTDAGSPSCGSGRLSEMFPDDPAPIKTDPYSNNSSYLADTFWLEADAETRSGAQLPDDNNTVTTAPLSPRMNHSANSSWTGTNVGPPSGFPAKPRTLMFPDDNDTVTTAPLSPRMNHSENSSWTGTNVGPPSGFPAKPRTLLFPDDNRPITETAKTHWLGREGGRPRPRRLFPNGTTSMTAAQEEEDCACEEEPSKMTPRKPREPFRDDGKSLRGTVCFVEPPSPCYPSSATREGEEDQSKTDSEHGASSPQVDSLFEAKRGFSAATSRASSSVRSSRMSWREEMARSNRTLDAGESVASISQAKGSSADASIRQMNGDAENRPAGWWEPPLSRVLAVVVSTVLMLAAGDMPPPAHLAWTTDFLGCIRDRRGQRPPNIAGLLHFINHIAPQSGSQPS